MTAFHRLGQDEASQLSRGDRRNGCLEKDPDMAALAGSRSLQINMNAGLSGRVDVGESIFLPMVLVEVRGKKPASLVRQHRIDADGFLADQVLMNNFVRERIVLARTLDAARCIGACGGAPVRFTIGSVAPLARRLGTKSNRIDILAAAKKLPEQ